MTTEHHKDGDNTTKSQMTIEQLASAFEKLASDMKAAFDKHTAASDQKFLVFKESLNSEMKALRVEVTHEVASLRSQIDDNYDLIKSRQRADNYVRPESNKTQTVLGTSMIAGPRDLVQRSSFH